MRRGSRLGRVGLGVLLGLGALAGGAAGATPPATALLQLAESNGVSLEEAVRQVRQRTGGRILAAETVREDGRTVHRIRVLVDEGRVKTFRIDAEGS